MNALLLLVLQLHGLAFLAPEEMKIPRPGVVAIVVFPRRKFQPPVRFYER